MNLGILKIIVAIVTAFLGWVIGYWLNSRRDQKTKRRELRVNYLIKAYRNLDKFIAVLVGATLNKEIAQNMNSAISDIQLFGTPNQIELAVKITEVLTIENSVPTTQLNQLIQELRTDLRNELGLESINSKVAYLNMSYENEKNT